MAETKRTLRRRKAIVGGALLAVAAFSLCITRSTPLLVSPLEVVSCYGLWIQQLFVGIASPADLLTASGLRELHPLYMQVTSQFGFTFIYVLAGFLLALAGALYQNVFRNPIASPAMLGVSSGIQFGVALAIFAFGTMAAAFVVERYAICYVVVAATLLALFGLTRLMSGRDRPLNVVNMLLVGTLINQLVGVFVTYLTWYVFDDETYDIFTSLTSMVEPTNDPASWAALLVGTVVAVTPVLLVRFRLNLLGFGPEDMRMLGVKATRLQMLALVCGSIMMITAQLQVGAVAMITLVVPHLSRAIFGAEFSKQFSGNLLLGALVLLSCRMIALLVPYPGTVPVGVVVNFVVLPAFVWMIATQQRKWD